MVAQEARRQYEADFDAEAQLLLGDVLAIVVERFGMVAQEAKVALGAAIASHAKRFRALAEAPPCRVIGGHLVYDAVALTEPIVLERALSRAFGEAIAQRTAGVVNTAAKGAGRRARGPAAGPNSGNGTTGAAALTACEVRDGGRRMATAYAPHQGPPSFPSTSSVDISSLLFHSCAVSQCLCVVVRSAAATRRADKEARDKEKAAQQKAKVEAKLKKDGAAAMADLVKKKGCFDKLSRQRRCCLLRCYGGELPGREDGVKVLPNDGSKDAQALAEWNKVKPSDLDAALAVLMNELAAANAAAGVATDEGDAAGDGGEAAVAEDDVVDDQVEDAAVAEDDVVDDQVEDEEDDDEDEDEGEDDGDDNMDDAEDKKEADADSGDEDVEPNSEDEDEDEDDGHEEDDDDDEDEVAIEQGNSHQCGAPGCVLFSCHSGLCIFGSLAPRKRGRPFR